MEYYLLYTTTTAHGEDGSDSGSEEDGGGRPQWRRIRDGEFQRTVLVVVLAVYAAGLNVAVLA